MGSPSTPNLVAHGGLRTAKTKTDAIGVPSPRHHGEKFLGRPTKMGLVGFRMEARNTMLKNSSTSFGIGIVTARPAAPTLTRRKSALVIRPMELASCGAQSPRPNTARSLGKLRTENAGIPTAEKSTRRATSSMRASVNQ